MTNGKRKANFHRKLTVLLLCSGAVSPAFAQAQDPQQDGPEIIVTATKIGSALSKAPVAATEIGGAALEIHRLDDARALSASVPSLVYSAPLGYGEAYIRGVGSHFAAAGLESAVATYVDGYYLQRQQGAAAALIDVQNVVVLKGPQGTLYGRNATGGAIVVTTNDPTDKLGGNVTAEYGRFDRLQATAVLNVPVSDTISVRIVGRVSHMGNYLTGIGGAPDAGKGDKKYIRAKIRWAPTENFTAVYAYEHDDEEMDAPYRENLPNPYCAFCSSVGFDPTGAGFYTTSVGAPRPFVHIRYDAHTLNLRYIGDSFSVTSVTGYRDQSTPSVFDQDYTPVDLFSGFGGEVGPNFQNDTFLRTTFASPFNFLVGASYMHEKDTFEIGLRGPVTAGFNPVWANTASVRSISVYGEGYIETGGFKLTLGARWTEDKKSVSNISNGDTLIFFGLPEFLRTWQESKTFHSVTPRAVLSYDTGNGLIYASFNRGARSGGFNSPALAPTDAVRPETLDSYELGFKASLLDNRLTLNAAAFYGAYKDIQVQTADAATGVIKLQNAASARLKGIEINADFTPVKRLHGSVGITWLDNNFRDFKNANIFKPFVPLTGKTGLDGSGTADLSGTRLPRSPKFSATFAADYTVPMGEWSLRASAIGRHTSSFIFSAGAGGPLRSDFQQAYTTVDGAIDLIMPGGKTTIGISGTNIFGTQYSEYRLTASSGGYYIPSVPASWTVRVRTEF